MVPPSPSRLAGPVASGFSHRVRGLFLGLLVSCGIHGWTTHAEDFRKDVLPLLERYCHDCHGDGMDKGGVRLDGHESEAALMADRGLWLTALKNVRSGMMPPPKKRQPTAAEKAVLERWILGDVFQLDPARPDPGRVTVRRLNRVEYRNTIKDLMGVDFDTQAEFPPDDTGRGFDTIADVLTVSPMLLEKYLAAAQTIVSRAVPSEPWVPSEKVVAGKEFRRAAPPSEALTNRLGGPSGSLMLAFVEAATASASASVPHAGRYRLQFDLHAAERFVDNQFDYNRSRLVLRADGEELLSKEFTREGNKPLRFEFDREWTAGEHILTVEVQPLTPDERPVRALAFRLDSVTVRGPMDKARGVRPKRHAEWFGTEEPRGNAARRRQARTILAVFAERAYRRPVDKATVDRLVTLAESTWKRSGKTFEAGVSQAMVAVLSSPRFLFREEAPIRSGGTGHPLLDEHALATRLSYFLWSTMPDAELMALAGRGRLRAELDTQLDRMVRDPRFSEFVGNFAGQWLQTRDVETSLVDSRQVLARETAPDPDFEARRRRFRELRDRPDAELTPSERKETEELRALVIRRNNAPIRADLTGEIRRAMRQETETYFSHVFREDRSVLELLDSNYTFLNQRLAKFYGLTNVVVRGDAMEKVVLPEGSPRGGLLTQGAILVVTSNPTRTSPVKRGLFILDNILGTPPPPPPPDVPPLEDAAKAMKSRTLSLRETLELHRQQPLCSSCHDRMDPLGLAFENFNAMGLWREAEGGLPVDPTGTLLTGEAFSRVTELKRILATGHSGDFYRTLTEKLLTYALGRDLEYTDVPVVDELVAALRSSGGSPKGLLRGIVGSVPFQRMRSDDEPSSQAPHTKPTSGAQARLQP